MKTITYGLFFLIGAGLLLGGIDLLRGNRWGLGKRFQEGFSSMGPLMLGMAGILCLVPRLGQQLREPAAWLGRLSGLDPAIFSSFLACDMGGYPLASELAQEGWVAPYCGLLLGSMLGCTVSFLLPVGLNLIQKEAYPGFFKGVLLGMAGIPFGSLAGGLLAGFPLEPMLWSTIPILLFALALLAGLRYGQQQVLLGCRIFARFLNGISILGLLAGGCSYIWNMQIFPGLGNIKEAILIVGGIALFLAGTFPLMELVTRLVRQRSGSGMTPDKSISASLLLIAVNPLPVLMEYNDLSAEKQIKSTAFMVCASCVMGDHLGYAASAAPEQVLPLVVGKLVGGMVALGIAELYCQKRRG